MQTTHDFLNCELCKIQEMELNSHKMRLITPHDQPSMHWECMSCKTSEEWDIREDRNVEAGMFTEFLTIHCLDTLVITG